MRWVDEITNRERLEKLIFSRKIKKSDDLIIWFDQLNFISLHHYCILHAWTIRFRIVFAYLRRFVSSIFHQYVNFASSRSTIIESRWFFHIYRFSRSSRDQWVRRLQTRCWRNQIKVTTKFEDSLIRRKNLVTIEDLDSQRDLDESWDEIPVDEIIRKRISIYI
jgi:hypothetical protein